MTQTIHLDIVSAEKEIFSGPAEMVVASGAIGEVGVVPGHAPLLTILKPGEIRVSLPGGEKELFYVSGGMLEVQPHCVTVLADEAERADSLDEAEAIKAQERAREAIANKGADFDYSKAAGELARAAAQVAAIQKLRKNMK
jgi:F-type H+-transporting ATPase subunit epsilon